MIFGRYAGLHIKKEEGESMTEFTVTQNTEKRLRLDKHYNEEPAPHSYSSIGMNKTLTAILVLVALSLTSCTNYRLISYQATEYNRALEQNNNEVLLLNILRASERRPLYFTALSKFSGTGVSAGASLGIPFGGASTPSYTLSPTTTISPAFDVGPLDTQEFMRGFLQPVGLDLMEYYLKQGWPPNLILALFVARVRQGDEVVLDNYPLNESNYECFRRYMNYHETSDLQPIRLKTIKEDSPVGAPIQASSAADIKSLVELSKQDNLSLQEDKKSNTFQLIKHETHYSFCRGENCKEGGARRTKGTVSIFSLLSEDYQTDKSSCISQQPKKNAELEGILRSPEGILYFLGEIVRKELSSKYIPSVEICKGNEAPLFIVRPATLADSNPYLKVEYDGKTYVIPRQNTDGDLCTGQRSMHALSLLSQLIGMQKSAKDLPSTQSVRIIGP
jgi:hypothetical protein